MKTISWNSTIYGTIWRLVCLHALLPPKKLFSYVQSYNAREISVWPPWFMLLSFGNGQGWPRLEFSWNTCFQWWMVGGSRKCAGVPMPHIYLLLTQFAFCLAASSWISVLFWLDEERFRGMVVEFQLCFSSSNSIAVGLEENTRSYWHGVSPGWCSKPVSLCPTIYIGGEGWGDKGCGVWTRGAGITWTRVLVSHSTTHLS